MNELKYINSKLSGKEAGSPRFLYKYRPFDKFTFDMLDKGYVYLCPANLLDDPSECTVDFSWRENYDEKREELTANTLDFILNLIKPYSAIENSQIAEDALKDMKTPDGFIKKDYLQQLSPVLQQLGSGQNTDFVMSIIKTMTDSFDKPEVHKYIEKKLGLAFGARESMGICSLSELKESEDMWQNYASNSTGYCVEYDMRQYKHLPLLYPVVYKDLRETNIVRILIAEIIGEVILTFSQGKLNADRSQYVQLFLTKDTKWAYQKEWRILGDAGQQLPAPKINSIILGRNMSELDKTKMISYCKSHNIVVNFN